MLPQQLLFRLILQLLDSPILCDHHEDAWEIKFPITDTTIRSQRAEGRADMTVANDLLSNRWSEDSGIGTAVSVEKRLQRGWLVPQSANDGVDMAFAARNLLASAAFDSTINNPMLGDVAGRRSYGKCQIKGTE